jgi:hypothetical protein
MENLFSNKKPENMLEKEYVSPLAGSKKLVLKLRSVNNIVIPANTGKSNNNKMP